MTQHLSRALLAGLLFASVAGCATSRNRGGTPTELTVIDDEGHNLAGEISLWSRRADESCDVDDVSCTVNLPGGFYSMTFRKARPARMGGAGGRQGLDSYRGCLRARVQLVPGRAIKCKQTQDFNCARGAYDTMECGESTASKYGYKPKKAEDDETEPAQRQAPVEGTPSAGPQKDAPPAPPQ